ncbi:MAG: DUF559 domain-containing protein, partial [Alphaproteobacteria bacterium]|nr:DUF559 domain-containing protein [Alphaproteobacteria bacterium]
IVEIDGPSHEATPVKDQHRRSYLQKQGYCVLRFNNADVLTDVNATAATILEKAKECLHDRHKKLNPSPHAPCACAPPSRGG